MLYPKTVKQLMNFTFVVIDDNQNNAMKTRATAESFHTMRFLGAAANYDDGLDIVLEHNPNIIFLEIDPQDKESKLSLAFINELHRYLTVIPKIIVTSKNDALCLDAFKYGVFDYFIQPFETRELRKTLFRLEKEPNFTNFSTVTQTQTLAPELLQNATISTTAIPVVEAVVEVSNTDSKTIEFVEQIENETTTQDEVAVEMEEIVANDSEILVETPVTIINESDKEEVSFIRSENPKEQPLVICVKSYGDYRYIDASDICFLQADNNSTDIHLNSGEMITAFKTLKHFEGVLNYPFVRIHNSYIVNIDFVSRIHTGNAVCHIKNTTTKLPFSKSYKENIDAIIATIASGNYLEI
jgi:DNA-binding LytR/AlgR family response regulator